MARAKTGGQIGRNLDFYKGGQFLPSTELPKRDAAARKKATRRQQVELGVWSVPPHEGARSIFAMLSGVHVLRDGKFFAVPGVEEAMLRHGGGPEQLARVRDMIRRYNAGERWTGHEEA